MINKLLEEEQNIFDEYARIHEWGSLDDRKEIKDFLKESNRRCIKAVLEESLASSIMGKLSAMKSPRPKEYYQEMQRKSVVARKRNARKSKLASKSE